MSPLILLQQMLILFAMALCGFVATRASWLKDTGRAQISSLVVHVLTPVMVISVVSNRDANASAPLAGQTVMLALLMHGFLLAAGLIYTLVLRFKKRERCMYQLLITFNNVGYMGIPLIRGVLGNEYTFFIIFYIMVFNVLMYTLGIWLASGMSGDEVRFSPKKLLNTGIITALAAILIFLCDIRFPAPVNTFLSYMGDANIPLSMIVIGSSLAGRKLRHLFTSPRNYLFAAVKMVLIPAVAILLARLLPFDSRVLIVGFIIVSMPSANIVGMMAEEYGGNGNEANALIAMTTVLSVATVPLLSFLY